MKQIEQTYFIKASVESVWNALTNAELIEKWGAGPAEFQATEGGKFSLWGGDINGINNKVEKNNLLEQDWYGHDHPDRCYKVAFKLKSSDGNTVVTLSHADVPDEEEKDFADGWKDYYFDPIKELLEKQTGNIWQLKCKSFKIVV